MDWEQQAQIQEMRVLYLEKLKAIFALADLKILNSWELVNQYSIGGNIGIAAARPWLLVKTEYGLIQIGWRKRVINIDWTDTAYRGEITTDDTTKWAEGVHAWGEAKAVEYLQELKRKLSK